MLWRLVLCFTSFRAGVCSSGADVTTTTRTAQEHDTPSADDVVMVQREVKLKSNKVQAIMGRWSQQLRQSGGLAHRANILQEDGAVVLRDELTPKEKALFGSVITAANVINQTSLPESELARVADMKNNAASNLHVFLDIVLASLKLIFFNVIIFIAGQYFLPNIYAFRATGSYLEGKAKVKAQDAPFKWEAHEKSCIKWLHYSFAYSREQLIETCGLDAAMLIAFTEMALEILLAIGVPFFVIGCPVYHYLGGMAASDDTLSSFGIGNVVHKSFIYWPVACSTWFVVIFTQFRLFQWMRMFIKYRENWLRGMPAPQCTTILVEGIPDELCSDAALKNYFQQMFGDGSVKEAFVVKKIANLESMVSSYKACHRSLKELIFQMKTSWGSKLRLQQEKLRCLLDMERLKLGIKSEQERISFEAQKSPSDTDIYATSGFVTFKDWRICEQAIGIRLRGNDGTLIISRPPEPADVIYSDLEQHGSTFRSVLGYAAISSLFLACMSIVHGISAKWNMISLEEKHMWVTSASSYVGLTKDTVPSFMPVLALTMIISILPTLLSFIFNTFFNLKASRWAQFYLQTYYFWFVTFLILLVTTVGRCLADVHGQTTLSPLLISVMFADRLPLTMDFYMNIVVLQWVTHAMNLTRFVNVMKYIVFKRSMEPEDARALSEPEDQDCCGMGSRSARFSLMFLVGLVFCSICPLLVLLVCTNFFICRLFYGYLLPYAEQRKSDLGGDHFALQLIHAHLGLLMYIIVMTVLLAQRAATNGPAYISAACFLWWAVSFHKFRTKLQWETLPFEDAVSSVQCRKRETFANSYQQRTLDPEVLAGLSANLFDE